MPDMGRRQSPLTTRGLELIAAGRTMRETAILLGLSQSTLARACKRAGVVLRRGRPVSLSGRQRLTSDDAGQFVAVDPQHIGDACDGA